MLSPRAESPCLGEHLAPLPHNDESDHYATSPHGDHLHGLSGCPHFFANNLLLQRPLLYSIISANRPPCTMRTTVAPTTYDARGRNSPTMAPLWDVVLNRHNRTSNFTPHRLKRRYKSRKVSASSLTIDASSSQCPHHRM